MCGIVVTTLTRITPTTILPISGQISLDFPRIHCPTTAPTTISAPISISTQTNKLDIPTISPTTVMHAIIAAIGTPNSTNTPSPADAPICSPALTDSCANFGSSRNVTSPNTINAPVQITLQT